MTPTLSPKLLEALRSSDGPMLSNAIDSIAFRLRNEGFTDRTIQCRFPDLPPMAGHAFTVKIRGASPPMGGRLFIERTEWWDALLAVPDPRLLVLEDASSDPGCGALIDKEHVHLLRALGCVGAVTNGAVRSLPAVRALGFHYFSGSVAVAHSYLHIVEAGTPVKVGGLTVKPGDFLHGDVHGIQSVPLDRAEQIVAAVGRIRASQEAFLAACRGPGLSVDRLRSALSARGI